MKNLITLTIAMIFSVCTAWSQAETHIVKSITCADAQNVVFELAGEVDVQEWDEDFIRINANVQVLNTSEVMLKRLVSVGRYNVEKTGTETINIQTPNMSNHIIIQGADLEEIVKYEISVPRGMKTNIQTVSHTNVIQSI